jgi:cobalamin biosynthesis protein CobD/CbiB
LRLHYRSTPPAGADARAAEQASVARGLRVAGVSIVLFGLLCAAAVPWLLASFGSWPYVLPASIVVVGLWLIVAGKRFRIAPPDGAIEPARGGQ